MSRSGGHSPTPSGVSKPVSHRVTHGAEARHPVSSSLVTPSTQPPSFYLSILQSPVWSSIPPPVPNSSLCLHTFPPTPSPGLSLPPQPSPTHPLPPPQPSLVQYSPPPAPAQLGPTHHPPAPPSPTRSHTAPGGRARPHRAPLGPTQSPPTRPHLVQLPLEQLQLRQRQLPHVHRLRHLGPPRRSSTLYASRCSAGRAPPSGRRPAALRGLRRQCPSVPKSGGGQQLSCSAPIPPPPGKRVLPPIDGGSKVLPQGQRLKPSTLMVMEP